MNRPDPDPPILRWAAGLVEGFDDSAPGAVLPLAAAGSDRMLWRLRGEEGSVLLVSNAPGPAKGPDENDSFVYLADHLRQKDLPAPEVFAYNRSLGAYIMEDLGDVDLFSWHRSAPGAEELLGVYGDAVTLLARMQTAARVDFDPSRCVAPGPYDRSVMLDDESGYFRRELLGGMLSLDGETRLLREECRRLADEAAVAGQDYFLHRDFQSMNLKIHDGRIWVIDFQGARLGPPQYDLAALLYDPYVSLAAGLRRKLLALYLESCGDDGRSAEKFMAPFAAVAAHRLMQALGAYGKLGHRQGKRMFLPFIAPALDLLGEVLEDLGTARFPALADATAAAGSRLAGRAQ